MKAMEMRDDVDAFLEHVGDVGGILGSEKLDGVRCLATVLPDGSVHYASKAGRPFVADLSWFDGWLVDAARAFGGEATFDGELCGENFEHIRDALQTDAPIPSSVTYHIFDIVLPSTPLTKRLSMLPSFPFSECVFTVQHRRYRDEEEINDHLASVVAAGGEGIVLKDAASEYKHGRSIAWCKIKAKRTVDLEVVDVVAGTGKRAGKMASLICCEPNNDELVRVAHGFTDFDRTLFLARPPAIIECEYSPRKAKGSISSFVFVRDRSDKAHDHPGENRQTGTDGV